MAKSAVPDSIFQMYWRFAAERHRIYERRLLGCPAPWTQDEVLSVYRFTNAFRAADRVSQYLIQDVIYQGDQSPDEVIFRTMLFKLFNKIDTWKLIVKELGYPSLGNFDLVATERLLGTARERGVRIYSNAYIVPPIPKSGNVKHEGHLRLVLKMVEGGLPSRIRDSESLEEVYLLIRAFPGLGEFLAYQFAVDINYSEVTNHDEDDFVVPGPGALDGISKMFPGIDLRLSAEIIKQLTNEQEHWFAHYEQPFNGLFGRALHLIDIQNLFCEISKYSRVSHPDITGVSGRTRIKQTFKSAGAVPRPFFPPKWGLTVPETVESVGAEQLSMI